MSVCTLFEPAAPQLFDDPRLHNLHEACSALADGFNGLDEQIEDYVEVIPFEPFDDAAVDVERFLDWLGSQSELTNEQRDGMTLARCRQSVEFVALRQRLAHLRFQELREQGQAAIDRIGPRTPLVLHLNPIHVWATLETHAHLDADTKIPARVVFFPAGPEVRMLAVEDEAADLLRRLEHGGPSPLRDLTSWASRAEREEIFERVREMAEAGLIALA